MVLIGCVYVRSAAIYCIKTILDWNPSSLFTVFVCYSRAFMVYWRRGSGGFLSCAGKGLCMQSGVSADRKDRKILCMTSVKGYRYRQRHSRWKPVSQSQMGLNGVFSPHGSRLPKVLCTPLQSYARCKGGILFGDWTTILRCQQSFQKEPTICATR